MKFRISQELANRFIATLNGDPKSGLSMALIKTELWAGLGDETTLPENPSKTSYVTGSFTVAPKTYGFDVTFVKNDITEAFVCNGFVIYETASRKILIYGELDPTLRTKDRDDYGVQGKQMAIFPAPLSIKFAFYFRTDKPYEKV